MGDTSSSDLSRGLSGYTNENSDVKQIKLKVVKEYSSTDSFNKQKMKLNDSFQTVVSELNEMASSPHHSQKKKNDLNYDLYRIANDFLSTATRYGRLILSEYHFVEEEKTIKPIHNSGGKIGGDKYIIHGIYFKLAVEKRLDSSSLLGIEMASKIAGHELKSLNFLWELKIPELHFPLQCLIDYLGYRLVAMLLLPIDVETLKVGTNDGGKTMKQNDEIIIKKMKLIGSLLNLAPHDCLDAIQYCVADLEGHLGRDDRRYIIDLSRLFPPCPPTGQFDNLYRLFRPEFVKSYFTPLCSDGFSSFLDNPKERKQHDDTLKEAYEYLINCTIPTFATDLDSLSDLAVILNLVIFQHSLFRIEMFLHLQGINLRFMGKVYNSCASKNSKFLLLIEMVARTIKRDIRSKWRLKMREVIISNESILVEIFLDQEFLSRDILNNVKSYYGPLENVNVNDLFTFGFGNYEFISNPNNNPQYSLRNAAISAGNTWGILLLFERVVDLLGVKLTSEHRKKLSSNPEELLKIAKIRTTFHLCIKGLEPVIKHASVVVLCGGYLLRTLGNSPKLSMKLIQDSLLSCPSVRSLRNLATEFRSIWELDKYFNSNNFSNITMTNSGSNLLNFSHHLLESNNNVVKRERERERASKRISIDYIKESLKISGHLDENDDMFLARVKYVSVLYRHALILSPNDTHTLFQYGNLLYEGKQYYKAEKYLLKSIIADPSHETAIRFYIDVLYKIGKQKEFMEFNEKLERIGYLNFDISILKEFLNENVSLSQILLDDESSNNNEKKTKRIHVNSISMI